MMRGAHCASYVAALSVEQEVFGCHWFTERFRHSRNASQAQDEAGQAQTARQGTTEEGCWQALIKALTSDCMTDHAGSPVAKDIVDMKQ